MNYEYCIYFNRNFGSFGCNGALLIFGPKRLPELGEAIGKMIREFKKSVSGIELENDNTKNVEEKKEDK